MGAENLSDSINFPRRNGLKLLGLPLRPGPKGDGWRCYAGLSLMYLLSQLFYVVVLRIPFFSEALVGFWQYLDLELLRTDLLRSLWHLHAQPPLMNLLIGVALKLSPGHLPEQVHALFIVMGWLAVLWLYQAMRTLGVRKGLCWLLMGWLCAFPTFALYSLWPYTTHLEFVMCALFALRLARAAMAQRVSARRAFHLCVPLCVLGFLRPQWHLALLLLPVVILAWLRRRQDGWRPYAAGTCALLPLLLLYAKNIVMFGVFSTSSWMGANLAQVMEAALSPEQVQALVDEGRVHPLFPRVFGVKVNFFWNEWSAEHTQPYEHPAYDYYKNGDWDNFNVYSMLVSAQLDLHDSLVALRAYLGSYLRYVAEKIAFMATYPSIAHECCGFTPRVLMEGAVGYDELPRTVLLPMEVATLLFYVLVPLGMLLASLGRGQAGQWRTFVMPAVMLALAMFVLSCAMNVWEQERMRWGQAPLYFMTLALCAEAGLRRVSRRDSYISMT